MLFYIVTIL